MLADDANLVRDEVGAVEADAEPARDGGLGRSVSEAHRIRTGRGVGFQKRRATERRDRT